MSEYYVVRYKLWPLHSDEDRLGRHTAHSTYEADSEIDAINAAMYYVRGRKSHFEMAYVHDVWGPFEERGGAKSFQWEKAGEWNE